MHDTAEDPPRSRRRIVRLLWITILSLLGTAVAAWLLTFALQHALRLVAWCFPSTESYLYSLGVFGIYRTTGFVTLDRQVPLGESKKWHKSCDDGYVLLAPFGVDVKDRGPLILDSRGELVWAGDISDGATATDVNIQTYQDEPVLTYWAGNKSGGTGYGTAYMLDTAYNQIEEIQAVGQDLRTDLHEFKITSNNTALITTINTTLADMRPFGRFHTAQDWVEDNILQEIDIATGELLFQWRALDHFSPSDSYASGPLSGYYKPWAYDFFHLNSAHKDSHGNYLLSTRHLHKLLYVSGQDGSILWTLGGAPSTHDFTDLSNGHATNFQWQHHARWLSEEAGLITLMDNGPGRHFFQWRNPVSRALILQLNTTAPNRTAELVHAYTSLDSVHSPSQGSVQELPNGHVFVGWGPVAAWSEFKPNGKLLCEFHFAASAWFWAARVKNYRAFKVLGWVGRPGWKPVARVKGGRVFISWNGATEVRVWKLQERRNGDGEGDERWEDLATIEKEGFESVFEDFKVVAGTKYRVVALDSEKKELGVSEPATQWKGEGFPWGTVVASLLLVACCGAGLWVALGRHARKRREKGQSAWQLGAWDRYKYSPL